MIIINCMCVHNVFMHCTGVILLEIIVIAAVGYCIYKLITLACLLTMGIMGNNQVTAWIIAYSVCN